MKIPETPPVGETPRSIQEQSLHKRIVTAFATLVLTTVYILAGAPAATAVTAPSVNLLGCAGDTPSPCVRGGMYILSASYLPFPTCGGKCSGFCPCPSLD